MKIGYKGLSADMKAIQGGPVRIEYKIGETYVKDLKESPRLCSSEGFHYCNKLEDTLKYYPLKDGSRYFEIEVLGPFTDGSDKSITTSFKLLREIPRAGLIDKKLASNLNLELVRAIQKQYPMFHVGGSTGLFLHGVRLKRWFDKSTSDLDFISPYFVLPESKLVLNDNGKEVDINYLDAKASGNDFDETFIVDGVKVDYRIDPKQRYEIIEHDGFKYKVSNLMTILEAKMRYAQTPSGQKHRDDITEMVRSRKAGSTLKEENFYFNY